MELIDNFNAKNWSKGDANDTADFEQYRIAHRSPGEKEGIFKFAIFNDSGELKEVFLYGSSGKSDPLNGIGCLELKLAEDGKTITGVLVEDECVLYTS